MPFARLARHAALLTSGALLLTGCGSGSSATDAKKAAVTLDNCGQAVRVETPPQRAVSLNQGTTEIMLSLGLADRMTGTATWTDPVMKGLDKENAKVERISDNNPSFERVLDAEPDFVAASFVSTLGKEAWRRASSSRSSACRRTSRPPTAPERTTPVTGTAHGSNR